MADKKIDPGLIVISVILLLVLGVGIFIYLQVRVDEISSLSDTGKNIPVLYVVADKDRVLLGDFVVFNTRTMRIACLDIPDNLGAIIDSLKRADSMGVLFTEKGLKEYIIFLEKLIGQQIPFYIQMDAKGFSEVIDLLGGLEVVIPESIDIKDEQNHVRIPSGAQVMDGAKTLQYLTYKDSDEREQEYYNRRWTIMKAFLSQMVSKNSYFQDATFMELFHRRASSNLDQDSLVKYVTLLKGVNLEDMISQRVMGSVRTVDGNKKLLFPSFEGQLLKENLRQIIANLESSESGREGGVSIKIEVLNGTSQAGMAKKTKDLFQNFGIDVITVGNAPRTDYAKTQVIDRKGDSAKAREVAKAIKCDNIITQIEGEGGSTADVTVILGRDFNGWTVK